MTKSLRNRLAALGLLASIAGATYAWAQGQPILTTLIGTELVTVQNAGPLAPATTINTIAAFVLGSVTPGPATFTTVTANDIAAGDASLGVAGLAAAQGGALALVGGTSSTTGNAGGAVTATGGTPGATGVGGAVSVAGGAGGATSGAGGAASVTGGVATAGNSAGGAASLIGGAGSGTQAGGAITVTSGAAGATGVAGAVNITVGAATAGNGSAVTITGGNGAGGTASGGAVNIVPGAAVSTGAPGEFQVNGNSNLMCGSYFFTGTPAADPQVFYIATRTMRLKTISQVHSTAAGGASTLTVTKDTGTSAPGAGTAVMTNTFNLNATANTVQNATLSATVATVNMAAGDRLAVLFANAIQASVGVVVTACMTPI